MVVKWNEEHLGAIKADLVPIKFFGTPKVEIQLGTVVSQAWAEVQHNIIYKNPDGLPYGSTPTMTRILDAINGLAITTDIMLVELEQNMGKAAREASNIQSLGMEYDRLKKEKTGAGFHELGKRRRSPRDEGPFTTGDECKRQRPKRIHGSSYGFYGWPI